MMNTKKLLLSALLLASLKPALACDSIYINVIGEASQVEKRVMGELKENLLHQYEGSEILTSNLYVFPTVEADDKVKANSLIVDLNSETDMTGSDVKVSLYKSDASGNIYFQGSQRISTNSLTKGKFKTLLNLAHQGINFSCGNY